MRSFGVEEEGVAVLDRIRPWLPPLLAMTANSPFWHGNDSGYASYRQQVWGRWPSSGPAEPCCSPRSYAAWWRRRHASGGPVSRPGPYASNCCAWPPGGRAGPG